MVKQKILPIKNLKAISDRKKIFYKIGEPLAEANAYIEVLSTCLMTNDKFEDFKKCVETSMSELRHAEELYGFPKE